MDALTKKISAYGTDTLMTMARHLCADTQDSATDVLSAILAYLEIAMPEAKFIKFCSELEEV